MFEANSAVLRAKIIKQQPLRRWAADRTPSLSLARSELVSLSGIEAMSSKKPAAISCAPSTSRASSSSLRLTAASGKAAMVLSSKADGPRLCSRRLDVTWCAKLSQLVPDLPEGGFEFHVFDTHLSPVSCLCVTHYF